MRPANAIAAAVTTAMVAAIRVRTGIGPRRHRRQEPPETSVVAPVAPVVAVGAFVVIHVLAGVVVPVILSRIGLVPVACLVELVRRGELARLRGDHAGARSGVLLLALRGFMSGPVITTSCPVVADVTRPADDDRT